MNSRLLASRMAASVLAVTLSLPTLGAQSETGSPFKGAFDGKFTGAVEGPILRATGGGAGTATLIGPFTYTEKTTVDLPTGLATAGTFQFLLANGDTITAVFVGRAVSDVPKGSYFVGLYTITGGTGRFQRATGTLTMHRYFDDTNIPAFNLGWSHFSGRIDAPGLK
ncbi:MAG: hypothetical protein U0Q16_33280 [Bryobacteraceae bacterium]